MQWKTSILKIKTDSIATSNLKRHPFCRVKPVACALKCSPQSTWAPDRLRDSMSSCFAAVECAQSRARSLDEHQQPFWGQAFKMAVLVSLSIIGNVQDKFCTFTLFEKSNLCPKIQFWQYSNIFTSYSPNFFWQFFSWNQSCQQLKSSKPPKYNR